MVLFRSGAVAVAAASIVATGAGVLWWRASGGSEVPGMAQYAAVTVGASCLGGFVLWHRPGNRYGLLHLAGGALFGSMILAAGALSAGDGLPAWAGHVALAWSWFTVPFLLPLWVMVIAGFPDGKLHRRSLGPITLGIGAVMAALALASYLLFPAGESLPLVAVHAPSELSGPLSGSVSDRGYDVLSLAGAVFGTLAPVLALVALADRYRGSGLVVRQQIKWLLAGATISVLLQASSVAVLDSAPLRTAAEVLVLLAVPLPFLAAAIAVFKHGLWEIDIVISHGLVYAALSGLLTAAFLAAALAVGVSVGGADGRVLAAMGLALLVSYLAYPVRRRLVSLVGRVLYGEGPRGLLAVSVLPDRHDTADARSQGARIAAVTRRALGSPWVKVWLFLPGGDGGVLRPVAEEGHLAGPPVVLPVASVTSLAELPGARRVSDLPAEAADVLAPAARGDADLVAALVLEGKLLGAIVCGARPGDPYGDDELALLTVVGRDAALALQNLHLEEELRRRLAEIEAQAEELRRSRQRLVNAQDQERRRIERDLHDGAQQQLVLLASALRRASLGADTAELNRLADQAEEAVFSLQELARGIYPSVLVDQGLKAALQTQAARLPVDVRFELGPGMHRRRLPRDLEAVLYYVALEAMTNAVKHAPGAQITVSLHTDERARVAVLEVHDDGPGFGEAPARGSGLQNMTDRLEAAGGRLYVESAPGAGTWIRAEVPVPATITAIGDGSSSP